LKTSNTPRRLDRRGFLLEQPKRWQSVASENHHPIVKHPIWCDSVRFAAEVGAGSDFVEVARRFCEGFFRTAPLLPLLQAGLAPWSALPTNAALPPKAHIAQHGGNVRFVPKTDISIWQWYQ
jgi:hypothetical protein